MTALTFAACRAAARAVRAAEHGRQAARVVRPRSVLGLVRSRGPISLLLYVASAENRLVHLGPGSFALLERPHSAQLPLAARGRLRLRLLRLIDRRWDLLLFAVPPVAALLVAAALAAVSRLRDERPSWAVVAFALAAMLWAGVFLTAQAVTESAWLRRTLGRRPRSRDELAAESLPGWTWSMPLCHHTGPGDGRKLLHTAGFTMEDLVRREAGALAGQAGAELTSARVRRVLVCLTQGVTTQAMRRVVAETLDQPDGPDSRVALRRPPDRTEQADAPVPAGGSFFLFWLAGLAAITALLALVVAPTERQACGDLCAGRPATYPDALRWLAWRLLWQDAPGLTPGTLRTQALGWLLTVAELMTVPVGWTAVKLARDRQQRVHDDYQEWAEMPMTRVLLLTVTKTEQDAVLAAVRPITGKEPVIDFRNPVVLHDLGAIGRTTLALARCARQGAGAPGGAQSTAAAAIRQWEPDVIIMVGTCYGLRKSEDSPLRLGDIILATQVHDLDHTIAHEDRTERRGDVVGPRPALVSRLQAAETSWSGAPVRSGSLLSAQTLVNSRALLDSLLREYSRAFGGEMEAHGLYAAAADAGVPWAVVKAISDWGVDRDRFYEPELAAANAAGFVAHAVGLGAFDDPGTKGGPAGR
ncbi:phosphorylase family protein [Actinoplanes sp. RD1]|uniref:phosphorylase family protein n=1 Tax=Actinoplanes sp. RD1 TaxID=3064538 RepID=UPI0027428F8F|nr:hypothetical protein [Actinoplanes sp. RD1]